MGLYKKKPVVIEAFQLPGLDDENVQPFLDWAVSVGCPVVGSERDGCLAINTLEGVMIAEPNDWIIKGVKGEFYPCKPDIFAVTYERVERILSGK